MTNSITAHPERRRDNGANTLQRTKEREDKDRTGPSRYAPAQDQVLHLESLQSRHVGRPLEAATERLKRSGVREPDQYVRIWIAEQGQSAR